MSRWLIVGDEVVLSDRYSLDGEHFIEFDRAIRGCVGTVVGVSSQGEVVDVEWHVDMPDAEHRGDRATRSFVDMACLKLYVEEPTPQELAEVYESLGVKGEP